VRFQIHLNAAQRIAVESWAIFGAGVNASFNTRTAFFQNQDYLAYTTGNHGGNAVMSFEDYTLAITEINANQPVSKYYAAYRQLAGMQALTLVDWFYENIDAIALQCASDSLQQTVASDDDVDVLPELIFNNNDNARLPMGNVTTGTDNWPLGTHGVRFEYEWPEISTPPVPFPYAPI
jgi:hypothetical protein